VRKVRPAEPLALARVLMVYGIVARGAQAKRLPPISGREVQRVAVGGEVVVVVVVGKASVVVVVG